MTSDGESREREELAAIAERLERERPVPAATFRGELRRSLQRGPRPEPALPRARARILVAAYGGCGTVLLAVAAVGVAGAGPFATG
jgi:hypothetical protein